MKLKKNRKFLVATAIILALVIGASATFAWVTSSAQLANEFKNDGFGSASNGMTIIENQDKFDFKIGVPQAKEVSVLNTTGSPMLARVSFEEMIKLLDSDNAYADYEWTASATKAAGFEPVPFKASDVSTWTPITWTGAPTGVTVKTPNPGASAPLCAVIYTDSLSKTWVAKFDTKPIYDPDTTTITGTPAVKYAYYKTGTAYYNTWNTKHNYSTWSTATPWGTNKPAATTFDFTLKTSKSSLAPTGAGYPAAVAAEAAKIKFIYDALKATATADSASWFYNENDGYFYYMKVIPGGSSSAMLLKELELTSAATAKMWEKYEYTLVVCVEGIQATKEALSDTASLGDASGWGLTGTLLTQLEGAITAYEASL